MVTRLPARAGCYAAYGYETAPAGWERVDVRALCHAHQSEWGDALTYWHGELMAAALAATPWAWVLEGSRVHVWHEPVRPLLFALGLLTYFRTRPGEEIWALGCPVEVGEYIRELSAGSVEVVDERGPAAEPRGPRRVARRAREVAGILRRVRPLRQRVARQHDVDLLIVSLGLSAASLTEHGDHYFGRVFDDARIRTHWLYQLASGDGQGVHTAVRESRRPSSFVHRLVSWADVAADFKTTIEIRRGLNAIAERVPNLRIAGTETRTFARRFFRRLLLDAAPLRELMLYRAVARLVDALTPAAVSYPYEDKGFERAILMAASAGVHQCRTIGFAHAAYTSGHLYLHEVVPPLPRPPRPRVLAAAGCGFGPWLRAEFGRGDHVVTVGSPRWSAPGGVTCDRRPQGRLRVLILTSFGHELFHCDSWREQDPNLFDDCDVAVRPHPHAWRPEHAAVLARLAGSVSVSRDRPLDRQIDESDVVVFCSTSAFAEAIWRARLVVHAEWSDLWITDPLKGKGDTRSVPYCTTPRELRDVLKWVASMDADTYAAAVAQQRVVGERVYAPFNSGRFASLLDERVPA